MGPRLQLSKDQSDSSFNADFLEESEDLGLADSSDTTKGIISSLMSNPLDLIQEDFPSTPSAVFSNHLLSGTLDDALGSRGPSYLSQKSSTGNSLDHATLAMQNLYVAVSLLRNHKLHSTNMIN